MKNGQNWQEAAAEMTWLFCMKWQRNDGQICIKSWKKDKDKKGE